MLPYVTVLVHTGRPTRESTGGVSCCLFDGNGGDTHQDYDDDNDDDEEEEEEDCEDDGATDVRKSTSSYDTRSLYDRLSRSDETLSAPSFRLSPVASAISIQPPSRHTQGTDVNAALEDSGVAATPVTAPPAALSRRGTEVQHIDTQAAGDGGKAGDDGNGGGGSGMYESNMYDSLLERLAPASPRLRSLPRASWLDLDTVSAAVLADLGDTAASAGGGSGGCHTPPSGADGAAAATAKGSASGSCQPTPPATPTQSTQQSTLTPLPPPPPSAPPPPLPSLPPPPPPPQPPPQQPQQPKLTVEGLARQVHGLQELVANLVGALQRVRSSSLSPSAAAAGMGPDSPLAGRGPAQRRRIEGTEPRSQAQSRRSWAVQEGLQADPTDVAGVSGGGGGGGFTAAFPPPALPARSGSTPAAWSPLPLRRQRRPAPAAAQRSAVERFTSPPTFVLGTANPVADGADGPAGGRLLPAGSLGSATQIPSRLLSPPPPPPPRLSLPGPGELRIPASSPPLPPPLLLCQSPSAAAAAHLWLPEQEADAAACAPAASTPTAFAAFAVAPAFDRSPSFSSSLRPPQRSISPINLEVATQQQRGLRAMTSTTSTPISSTPISSKTPNANHTKDDTNGCLDTRNSAKSGSASQDLDVHPRGLPDPITDFSAVSPQPQPRPRPEATRGQDQSPQRFQRRSLQQQQHTPRGEAFPGASRLLRKSVNAAAAGGGGATAAASSEAVKAATAALRRSSEATAAATAAAAAARESRRVLFGDDPAFHEARKAYIRKWQTSQYETDENRWVRRLLAPDIAADPSAVCWQGASPTSAVATWAAAAATATAAAAAGSAARSAASSPTVARAETPRSSMAGMCSEADGYGGFGAASGGQWCSPRRRAVYVEHMVDFAVEALAGLFASYGAPLGLTKLAPYTYGLDSRRLRLKMLPDGRLAVRCGSGWEEFTLALAKLPLPRHSAARAPAAPPPGRAAAAFGGHGGGGYAAAAAPAFAGPPATFQWF
ncbi:hypothetical protein PLESTF_001614200 [Pleodorina starrii]|nr:hypothetical protein PLESTF_001614200 [Pleodorina starrii]